MGRPAVTPETLTRPALSVRLPLPVSTNHAYATVNGRRVLTEAARDYKRTAGWLTKAAMTMPGAWPIPPPYDVTLCLFLANGRRFDVGNAEKLATDAIFAALGVDDSLITRLHIFKDVDRINPRLDVVLRHAGAG